MLAGWLADLRFIIIVFATELHTRERVLERCDAKNGVWLASFLKPRHLQSSLKAHLAAFQVLLLSGPGREDKNIICTF